jgi:DNA-binding CsgD family transcriptional regulator
VFEALLSLLDALSQERPLALSIEDIHWADSSTRAFLAFLARSLCGERVMVIASYRTDELHRRHPLRPLLAELERTAGARRIELAALTREELREQLEDILGGAPDSDLLDRMWARSEGNPLFTEELLAAGLDGRAATPPTLRDALMVRMERLDESTQGMLRLLAVGRRLDPALLEDAGELEPAELRGSLREAVASHIVQADEDGFYRFRHALLREVVMDDLLPGERTQLHLALARALERRAAEAGDGAHVAAGIAHHYFAAGDQRAALAASVHAADAAHRVHGYGEAAGLLERALDLFDRVPDAEAVAGASRAELLKRAAAAHQRDGDVGRQEQLLRRALELVDEREQPYRAAELYEELARAHWSLNRSEHALDAAKHALSLLPDADPSRERARLLAWLAKARMLQGKYVLALELASEAIVTADAAGDVLAESRGRNARGIALVALGDFEPGIGELRQAIRLALERGTVNEVGSAYTNLAECYHAFGRTGEAIAIVEEGRSAVLESGGRTSWLDVTMAEYLWQLGEWELADGSMPPSERPFVGTTLIYVLLQRATMALGRGEHGAARADLERAGELVADSTEAQFLGAWGTLTALLALREGDVDLARGAIDEALDRIEFCTEDAGRIVRLSAVGVAIEAEAAQRARDLNEDPDFALSRAELMLARVRAAAAAERPVECAWLAMAEAHFADAEGEPSAELWARAAEAWDALEWPYEAAVARRHEAEALVVAGDRAAAATVLQAALASARRLGAGWLRGELEGLAARARLQPERAEEAEPEPAPVVEEPFGLTPRERQVLALVAEGRTNREIGDTLYMAEKTASVHVSRILSKLDVRSRTEAAAVAHRLGLDAVSETGRQAAGA